MAGTELPNGIPTKTPNTAPGADHSNGLHPWLKNGEHFTPVIPAVADWINLNVPKQCRILDAGCGNGELLKLLLEKGFQHLRGCDVEPGHALLSADRLDHHDEIGIYQAPLLQMSRVWTRHFKVVTCLNWLQNDWQHKHAIATPRTPEPDPEHFEKNVQAAHRLLCEDGLLLFDRPPARKVMEVMSQLGFHSHREYDGFTVWTKSSSAISAIDGSDRA